MALRILLLLSTAASLVTAMRPGNIAEIVNQVHERRAAAEMARPASHHDLNHYGFEHQDRLKGPLKMRGKDRDYMTLEKPDFFKNHSKQNAHAKAMHDVKTRIGGEDPNRPFKKPFPLAGTHDLQYQKSYHKGAERVLKASAKDARDAERHPINAEDPVPAGPASHVPTVGQLHESVKTPWNDANPKTRDDPSALSNQARRAAQDAAREALRGDPARAVGPTVGMSQDARQAELRRMGLGGMNLAAGPSPSIQREPGPLRLRRGPRDMDSAQGEGRQRGRPQARPQQGNFLDQIAREQSSDLTARYDSARARARDTNMMTVYHDAGSHLPGDSSTSESFHTARQH